jgi:hypothetical protein
MHLWIVQQRFARPAQGDATVFDHVGTGGQTQGLLDVLLDDQNRDAGPG